MIILQPFCVPFNFYNYVWLEPSFSLQYSRPIMQDRNFLGRELAYELAKRDAQVVLGCRDLTKANEAIRWICERIGNNSKIQKENKPILQAMQLDLASLVSVEHFASEFLKKYERLHILVNNAGVMGGPFSKTPGGIENTFAVNHLGHFHLTNLLLDKLRQSAPSRIVIISSGYYKKMKNAEFNNLKTNESYEPLKVYAQSKLANCLHGLLLRDKLQGTEVGVYTVRPGFVRGTQLGRHFSRIQMVLFAPLIWFMSKNLNQGVQTMLHCCIMDDLKSGAIYDNCEEEAYKSDLVNDEHAKELWNLSEELVRECLKEEKKKEN